MSLKVKGPAAPPPLLKNAATAPFVYFTDVPVFGTNLGNIEIELASRMLMPRSDGGVALDMSCVAHLRCTPASAIALIDALQKALDMLRKGQEKPTEVLSN